MHDLIAIVVLANTARGKGRSFAWGLLAPALAYPGMVLAIVFCVIVGLEDLAFLALIGGFLAGLVGAWVVVDRLEPVEGFEGGLGGTPSPECPSCGSSQTELTGGVVLCYACDAVSEA